MGHDRIGATEQGLLRMTDLRRGCARWQHIESQGIRAGRRTPQVVRTLASPIHAVEAGAERALCGAYAPVTEGEVWRVTMGVCPRCADLAKHQDS